MQRFLLALEDRPGGADSLFDWRDALGDQLDAAAFLLRRTGALARRVGCPSPGGADCPRRVIRHADGSVAAVCGNQPADCDRLTLSLDDLAILELDWPKLADQLCRCLGMRCDFRAIDGIPRAWQVGWMDVAAGAAFRVVASLPAQEADLDRVTLHLVGRLPKSALLLPTRRQLSPKLLDTLLAGGCDVAVLDEIIEFSGPGQLSCAAAPQTLFARTWDASAPAEAADGRAWALPADARWEELRFEFEAAEMLRITFRKQTRPFEPVDLTMRNAKTRRPNAQWALLRSFAIKDGVIARTAKGFDQVESQKQQLSRRLRAAFGIAGDPILWENGEQAYRTRFVISGAKLRCGR